MAPATQRITLGNIAATSAVRGRIWLVATVSLVAVCVVVSGAVRSMQTKPQRVVEYVVAIGWLRGARPVTVRDSRVLVFVKRVVSLGVSVSSVAMSMQSKPRRVVESVGTIGWLCGARNVTMKQPCFPAFVHSATAGGVCIVQEANSVRL